MSTSDDIIDLCDGKDEDFPVTSKKKKKLFISSEEETEKENKQADISIVTLSDSENETRVVSTKKRKVRFF